MAAPHAGSDPHGDEPVVTGGADLADASAAVVLVHGRGATARSILELGAEVADPDVAPGCERSGGRSARPLTRDSEPSES